MKKIFIRMPFYVIFVSLLLCLCTCNYKKELKQGPAATDSMRMAAAEGTAAINSQFFGYQNDGEINTDSTISNINEIKSLSNKDFRKEIKILKQGRKSCSEGKIIKKPGTFRFSLKGLNFFVNNQQVVGVGSLDLSQDALSAITEKLGIIDDELYSICTDLTMEFSLHPQSDTRILKLYDMQERETEKLDSMGSTLNQLNQTGASSGKVKNAVDSIKSDNKSDTSSKKNNSNSGLKKDTTKNNGTKKEGKSK